MIWSLKWLCLLTLPSSKIWRRLFFGISINLFNSAHYIPATESGKRTKRLFQNFSLIFDMPGISYQWHFDEKLAPAAPTVNLTPSFSFSTFPIHGAFLHLRGSWERAFNWAQSSLGHRFASQLRRGLLPTSRNTSKSTCCPILPSRYPSKNSSRVITEFRKVSQDLNWMHFIDFTSMNFCVVLLWLLIQIKSFV